MQENKKILSIGSLVIDRINGKKRPGGEATNVAVNTQRLGVDASLLTVAARSPESVVLQEEIEALGVSFFALSQVLEKLPECHIYMGADGKEEGYDWIDNGLESAYATSEVPVSLVQAYQTVYLAACEPGFAYRVSQQVQSHQTVVFNPGTRIYEDPGMFMQTHRQSSITFMNQSEFDHLQVKKYVRTEEDLLYSSEQMVIITAGKNGARLVTKEGIKNYPAQLVPAIDETGAGDSFASAVIWALGRGLEMDAAMVSASILASLVVQRVGAQIDAETAAHFIQQIVNQ